ncbi:head-tail connector protein [Roseicyclus marinus]|uniref:head-tail connector protein n=1 Tax=Roseicyclus marinus TaxID=2161673 RepID=UPI00240F8805|nr:head-tail connector protein [Roseicyclus marinus]MDG3040442.1 head-tail connector protein [Roseicyclus marinus]
MTIYCAARLLRLTDPVSEPVTLAEARAHLRMDPNDTSEDSLIESVVKAAREHVEDFCNRPFVSATWAVLFDGSTFWSADEALHVPVRGVTEITGVTYRTDASASVTWSAEAYEFDAERQELRAKTAWPVGRNLRIALTAGNADSPVSVPNPIRQAILLCVGDLYELREAHVVGTIYAANPAAVNLMMPYRERMGL